MCYVGRLRLYRRGNDTGGEGEHHGTGWRWRAVLGTGHTLRDAQAQWLTEHTLRRGPDGGTVAGGRHGLQAYKQK